MKIWGSVGPEGVIPAKMPLITTQCHNRVNVSDGHMAAVLQALPKKTDAGADQRKWAAFAGAPQNWVCLVLPKQFCIILKSDRPQPKLDRMLEKRHGRQRRTFKGKIRQYDVICLPFS